MLLPSTVLNKVKVEREGFILIKLIEFLGQALSFHRQNTVDSFDTVGCMKGTFQPSRGKQTVNLKVVGKEFPVCDTGIMFSFQRQQTTNLFLKHSIKKAWVCEGSVLAFPGTPDSKSLHTRHS